MDEAQGRYASLRFVAVFLAIFGALYGTLTYWTVAREWVVDPWTSFVASVAARLLRLFDSASFQIGNSIVGDGFAISIIDGCNGVTPLALLVAGVLAFPATWRARAVGLGVGIPAVMVINMVRITALYLVGAYAPEWFDRSHVYVAQAFVILVTAGVWLWWLARVAQPPAAAPDR